MEVTTHSLIEFNTVASDFVCSLAPRKDVATVVALSGELGAGKTTFVQQVARELGVDEHVASPTFVIEKIYELEGKPFARLIHIDAYRLKEARELEVLGWSAVAADPGNLIFIEWQENVAGLLPHDTTRVTIKHIDEDTREITIH